MLFPNSRLAEDFAGAFSAGLDGLEVYHFENTSKFEFLKEFTNVYTIGSDYHSEETEWDLGCKIGNELMPDEDKEKLLKYLGLI